MLARRRDSDSDPTAHSACETFAHTVASVAAVIGGESAGPPGTSPVRARTAIMMRGRDKADSEAGAVPVWAVEYHVHWNRCRRHFVASLSGCLHPSRVAKAAFARLVLRPGAAASGTKYCGTGSILLVQSYP